MGTSKQAQRLGASPRLYHAQIEHGTSTASVWFRRNQDENSFIAKFSTIADPATQSADVHHLSVGPVCLLVLSITTDH